MVAQAVVESGRCWDVHYNISPQEPDGHYLLVPEIALATSRRSQRLLLEDCIDIVMLGRACEGQLCVNFNSPNAGASQNHIHIHAWTMHAAYGVMRAPRTAPVGLPGGVQVAGVEWPATCLLLSGGAADAVGRAMHTLLTLAPTHNVAVVGSEAFVFLRGVDREIAPSVPGLKLGSPQMLGHFVVDSVDQFEMATKPEAVEQALRHTRHPDSVHRLIERLVLTFRAEQLVSMQDDPLSA